MAQQFWTKFDGRVRGPYSATQIRKLVKKTKLPDSAEISTDGKKFRPLSVLKTESLPSINKKPNSDIPAIPPLPCLPAIPEQQTPSLPEIDVPVEPAPAINQAALPEVPAVAVSVPEVSETIQVVPKASRQFDVFISYRRKGGAEIARLVADNLERAGFRVFLDIDGLSSGSWSQAIEKRIEECPDFIPILTEGFFDRCQDPDDVVRKELELAMIGKKNIVPFFLSNPPFPETLPASIAELTTHNGVSYSHEYSKECIGKLRDRLSSTRFSGLDRLDANESQPKWVVIIIGVIIAVLMGATTSFGFSAAGGGFFSSLTMILIQFPIMFLTKTIYLIVGLFVPVLGALFGASALYKIDPNKLFCGPEWTVFWLFYTPVIMFISSFAGLICVFVISFVLSWITSENSFVLINGIGSVSSLIAVGLFLRYFFKKKLWRVVQKILPA